MRSAPPNGVARNLVTNIFCENALETALQFREAHGGKITVVTCGGESAEEVLRKALALRADDAVLIQSEVENPDPLFVAHALAAAIRKLEAFDIVLVGREAGDWARGKPVHCSPKSWACRASLSLNRSNPLPQPARCRSNGKPKAAGNCSRRRRRWS